MGPQGLLVLGLPAPFVPHSASLSPATTTRVLSAPVPVSTPPTGLDVCFFFIYLASDFLAVRFSVSSGCARRRSVSTYVAILVLDPLIQLLKTDFYLVSGSLRLTEWESEPDTQTGDQCDPGETEAQETAP